MPTVPMYPPTTMVKCPVKQGQRSHHVHLDLQRLENPAEGLGPKFRIPEGGELCSFTCENGNTFLGRILRTIEWQQSQKIVRVEHDNGLASFALAIPHQCLYKGWTLRLIQLFAGFLHKDSEDLAEGEWYERQWLVVAYGQHRSFN